MPLRADQDKRLVQIINRQDELLVRLAHVDEQLEQLLPQPARKPASAATPRAA